MATGTAPLLPALSTRERNKHDKWQRIKAAASQLFAERGFEGTTTRAIAERAGVASGTLFLYSKTKEQLLFRLFAEEIAAAIEHGFETLDPTQAPLEQVVFLFSKFFAFYEQDERLSRVLVKEMTFVERTRPDFDAHLELTTRFLAGIDNVIEAAIASGEFRADLSPPQVSANFFSAYLLALFGWLNGYVDTSGRDGMFRAALELQLEGIRERKTA